MKQLPKVKLLGNGLPPGWWRPTHGLVEAYRRELSEGLAPPSSPHLRRPASRVTRADLKNPEIRRGIELLGEHTNRDSTSPLKAVGMAFPQLACASKRNVRALAVQLGMADAREENRTANVATLLNPSYKPVKEAGMVERRESCFSAPGIGVVVMRWKKIILYVPGKTPQIVEGTDAWFLQHEIDHLEGLIDTELALNQGRPLYYLPPEWRKAWRQFTPDWPVYSADHYNAMQIGEFDLKNYFKYLKPL